LKIVVLAIVSLCLLAAQPSVAKEGDGHHTHHASAKGAPTWQSGTDKGTNPIATSPNDTIDMDATGLPPRSGSTPDNGHDVKPSLEITKPKNFQARRPEPSIPVVRNAIGQSLTRPANPAADGKRVGSTTKTPAADFGAARASDSTGDRGYSDAGGQNFRPPASVSVPSRSKIGGAELIRPSPALSGLGGPAKTVAGINGTTLRPKR
jgi:hypothetical protein